MLKFPKEREAAMDQLRPSFPNPTNTRYPAFFSSPNPHHNHHHHHLPPPPSLPPPPPRPIHQSPISLASQPPPPNSFHLHHGSYQFVNPPQRSRQQQQQPPDPNIRDNGHNLGNRFVDFVQSPRRASERLVVVDRRLDRPLSVYRDHDGVWEPSIRVPRVYIDHEHPPYRPTYQPVDRVRKGGNSDLWQRVDELPRERRSFHIDRSQREVDHRKGPCEHLSRSVPQKELIMQGRDDGMKEYLMWENLPRGAHHPPPTQKRNRAMEDDNRFYEKGKIHVLESQEKYEDRDRWEGGQDCNATPSKKQKKKKKNVMERIQPALTSYIVNCEHSPRDEESSQMPDLRLSLKERARSPVVSFKSNLLIVASSDGAGAKDVSVCRDDQNRNELDNKDDLLLPYDLVEKVPLKSDSGTECDKSPMSSKKEEIHLEKKPKSPTYLKKVKSFVSQYLPVGNSEAPSLRTECISGDKEPSKSPSVKVLNRSCAASGSSKESSPSSSRKRKITNPHISLSSSQVLAKDLGSSSVDHVVSGLSSESMLDVGLKDSVKCLSADVNATEPTEVALTVSHMKSTAVGSSKAVDGTTSHLESTAVEPSKAVDGECANDSVGASAPKKKRKRVRKRRPCLSGQVSGTPVEIQVDDTVPTQDVQRPSNSEGMINTGQKEISSNTAVNYGSNLCLDVVSIPLQLDFAEGSSNATSSLGGCSNVLSAIDSMGSSERSLSFMRTGGGKNSASSSGGARQSQTSASLEEGEIEESMGTNPSEQDTKSTKVSVLGEFFVSDVSNGKLSITGAANNVIPQNSGQSFNVSDANVVDGDSNMLFTGKLCPSIDDGVSGGSPESEMLKGNLSLFPAEGSLTKKLKKRKTSELHSGTGKFDALSLTLGCPSDSGLARDRIAGSGLTCPGAQLELHIGDSISTNVVEGGRISSQEAEVSVNPAEVETLICDKNQTALAPELGSALGPSTEICRKVAYSDADPTDEEVAKCSPQVVPQSSVQVGLSVSEFSSQSGLTHHRNGLELNNGPSAGLKLAEETRGKGTSNFDIPDEKQTSSLPESVRCLQGSETLLMNGMAASDCSLLNQCSDQNVDRPQTPILNADHNLLVSGMECDIDIPVKADQSSESEHLMLCCELASDERVTNSSPTANIFPLVDHPENLSSTTSMELFDAPGFTGNPDGKLFSVQRKSKGKSMKAGSLSSFPDTAPINTVSSEMASVTDSSVKSMPVLQASQTSKDILQIDRKKQTQNKNGTNLASSKPIFSRSSYVPSGRKPATAIKPRTWHRTDNSTSVPPGQSSITTFVPQQKKTFSPTVGAQSNSYVRKGNSLLRNPVTAVTPAPKIPALASDDPQNTPSEVTVKLASPCNIVSSNCNVAPIGDSRFSPVIDCTMATENEPEGFSEDIPNSSRNSEIEMKSLEDQGSLSQAALSARRVVYIKRKSNQLVAASNTSTEISASNKDVPALMSDVYYKSTKNQLVRATPETNQAISDPIEEGRRVFRSYGTKRNPNRVPLKIPKSRKLSLVWKLCNTWSPKKGVTSLRCKQVLPHLLPWKRATYRRNLVRTSADFFKNSPLSNKLLSSRKMHIMYKRSGFSLRRSKVVSLAGPSLKWSISLERRSKKVEKEATSAVTILKKENKEKSCSSGIQKTPHPLHEEQSRIDSGHQVKKFFKSSMPRRSHIRNDEYVRNGNGNQLIRNPKRRTRILANEKVRWSLHTARMRLAKKRKYCQFFTRFGKCNKEEGKCPYIHDPSKTAVCTKFLNGLCSDPKCKLTHEVIPERMPDCSFFLQGLCSNESCPYRHVSVNPKAPTCESFLTGYCADGNECRKKHSYMCPVYEATGECPEGTKCKLYHPKKAKEKKTKNTRHQKSARGRYFESKSAANSNETETEGSRKRAERKDESTIAEDEALGDYISLDFSEEEAEEEEVVEQQDEARRDAEQPNVVVDDPDELIKPMRLLRMMSQAAEGLA